MKRLAPIPIFILLFATSCFCHQRNTGVYYIPPIKFTDPLSFDKMSDKEHLISAQKALAARLVINGHTIKEPPPLTEEANRHLLAIKNSSPLYNESMCLRKIVERRETDIQRNVKESERKSTADLISRFGKVLDKAGRAGVYKEINWQAVNSRGSLYVRVVVRPAWYYLELDAKRNFAKIVDAFSRLKAGKADAPPSLIMFEDSRTGKTVARYSQLGLEVF
jgi:hypothetical protein